jgi:hypothetical protein
LLRERSLEKRVQDDTWSWVGEDGVEHHGSESQLAAALSAQRLAPYTLVTRASWRDWLPAMVVAQLQRSLHPTSRDVVRTPTTRHHEPKLPPPMHEYPALRLRHHGLQQGVLQQGVLQQGALQQGATPVPSRPRSSIPSSPHLELARYANDDFDEPTVQIDAEELERALNESRVDDAPVATPRSALYAEPPGHEEIPLVNHDVKRRALAQRLAHKMPTYPGYVVGQGPANQQPSTPPPPGSLQSSAPPPPPAPRSAPSSPVVTSAPMTPPSVPSAPIPAFGVVRPDSAPKHAPPPPPPFQPPHAEGASFGAHEPTLTSRIDSGADGETRPGRRKVWLTLVAVCGTLAGAAWFATQRVDSDAAPSSTALASAASPVKLPAPAEAQARIPLCTVEKQLQVSEFAHAQVRPAFSSAGQTKLALGFAQTGRIASGLTLDAESLAIDRLYTDNQTSPLWSVTPVVSGSNPADVKFRVSRAASTLRSTVTLATVPPLFFGLNREGLAVRGDADLIDRLVWKSEWDTISIPDVAALAQGVSLVTLRAGGERGKILLGKVSPTGQAIGELSTLTTGSVRIEAPSLLVTEKQILVTYAAGDKPLRDKVFIATSSHSSLPTTPKEVFQAEGVVAPTLARVGDVFALQYTRGVAGKQEVVTTVLDSSLERQSEPLVVSPVGRDAYDGVIVNQGGALLSVYFVRQEFGHELWASKLVCK